MLSWENDISKESGNISDEKTGEESKLSQSKMKVNGVLYEGTRKEND